MTQPTSPRIRQAYLGCALLLGTAFLFAGSVYFWATRPIASEAQIQAAAARVERARNEMPTSCPRPVLRGVALPGDGGEGFGDLARAEEPYLRCLRSIQRYRFRAQRVVLEERVTTRPTLAPSSTARLAALEPPPFERVAVVECAALDTAVQAVLQRASGCAAQRLFHGDRRIPDIQTLGLAMFNLARARIHEGRLQEGIELLLDMIRLGQDATRGHVSLTNANLGLQLQSDAAHQLQALLASDLPWTSAMLGELARQASVLVASTTQPTAWFDYDPVSVRENALRWINSPAEELTESSLRDIAVEDYAETRWPDCAGLTLEACNARYREEIDAATQDIAAWWRVRSIPGAEREGRIRETYRAHLREREAVLVRAARNEALLRALPALFLHRRMSLSGTCPTAATLQAEALAAGMAGGFEVVDATQSILLNPPGIFSTSIPRPSPETAFLYRAVCTPLREP